MSKFFDYTNSLPAQQAVLITSDVNRRYVSDFASSDGTVFATCEGVWLFVDMRYYEMACIAKQKGKIPAAITVVDSRKQHQTIEGILAKGIRKVQFEDRRMTCARLEAWKKSYPQAEFLPLGDTVEKMRAVKTPEELRRICAAQELTTAAYHHVLPLIRKGTTEAKLALEMDFFMRANGAEASAFETIVISGSKTSLPHGKPEDLPLTENSFITMDFGAKLDGYCSDMTRTVVLGKADERQKEIYHTVLRAQEAALKIAKGGIPGKEVDKAARDVIAAAGYGEYFTHSTGHSLGMEVHESPNFSPREESPVPVGAVVSVEPGIYLEGEYGVRIEDTIVLTPEGCENLTPVKKELLEL